MMNKTTGKLIATLFSLSLCFSSPSTLLAQDVVEGGSWDMEAMKEEYRLFGLEPQEMDSAAKSSDPSANQTQPAEEVKNENAIENMYAGGIIPQSQKPLSNTEDVPERAPAAVQADDLKLEAIKERFLLFGNLTGLGSYSSLVGSSSTTGGNISGYLAPAYKVNEKMFFILLVNGLYNKSKQVYVEDTGPRLSTETRSYSVTPTVKYAISDTLSISPSFIYTRSQSRQDSTVRWGEDLYDYTETGGSLVLESNLVNTNELKRDISITLQSYHRKYPNFVSLLTLTGLGSLEEKEKDYDGFLLTTAYRVSKPLGLSYKLTGNLLYKKFTDKLVENESGERDNVKQKDLLVTLTSNLDYKPTEKTSYLLDLTYTYNFSNQNLATGSFPVIEFTRNYHGYYNVIIKPGMQYTMDVDGKNLILKGQYGFNITRYLGRNAKSAAGVIVGKEEDITHELSFLATYNYSKYLDLLLSANYQNVNSNMKEETTFRYNYSLFNVSLGFSYNF